MSSLHNGTSIFGPSGYTLTKNQPYIDSGATQYLKDVTGYHGYYHKLITHNDAILDIEDYTQHRLDQLDNVYKKVGSKYRKVYKSLVEDIGEGPAKQFAAQYAHNDLRNRIAIADIVTPESFRTSQGALRI
jgi:hypothetical protein